jgi:uncharacterized protein (TIGR03437 family)
VGCDFDALEAAMAGAVSSPTVNGNVWQNDSYYLSGKVYAPSNLSSTDIYNTSNNELYRKERYSDGGPLEYAIPVANGSYTIRLHFAEIWYGVSDSKGSGARLFNVQLENSQVLSNYDIYSRAGGSLKAVIEEFQATVTDGVINLRFTSLVDNAKVSGIEVIVNNNTQPAPQPNPTPTPVPTPTPTPTPATGLPAILLANGNGVVFNAGSLKTGPFTIETAENLGDDKRTRLMIFASGISSSINTSHASSYIKVENQTIANLADSVKVEARASDGRIFELPVEYAGAQGVITGLDQINVMLTPELQSIGNLQLTIIVGGYRSNSVAITVR